VDGTDRTILNLINLALPLTGRPFCEVARRVGLSEEEVIARIRDLKERGVIRRLGAVIDPRKIEWTATLCAADIPESRLEEYASLVGGYAEVTHNYVREGRPNCWFTIIAPDRRRIEEVVKQVEQALDTKILDLPARKVFKIKVGFDLE
jgi:DNA-binding Lrp family transcriptional regulator